MNGVNFPRGEFPGWPQQKDGFRGEESRFLREELAAVKHQLCQKTKQLENARQQINGLLKRQHEDAKTMAMLRKSLAQAGSMESLQKLKLELEAVKQEAEEIRRVGEMKVEHMRNIIMDMNQEVTGVIKLINSDVPLVEEPKPEEVQETEKKDEFENTLHFLDSDSEDDAALDKEEVEFLFALQAYQEMERKRIVANVEDLFPVLTSSDAEQATLALYLKQETCQPEPMDDSAAPSLVTSKTPTTTNKRKSSSKKESTAIKRTPTVVRRRTSVVNRTPTSALRRKMRESLRQRLNWGLVEKSDSDDEEYRPSSFSPSPSSLKQKRKSVQSKPEVTSAQHVKLENGIGCTCGYKGPSKGALRNHMDYHTLGKKFQCEHCPQKFLNCYHLKIHKKKAHGVMETGSFVGCRQCGQIFKSRPAWKQHRQAMHGK